MHDKAKTVRSTSTASSLEAEDFFAAHGWCVNPILPFQELWTRLDGELDNLSEWKLPWQQQELRINLYLLSSAIGCTADDYLSRPRWHIRPLEKHLPRLGRAIRLGERILNLPDAAERAYRFRELWRWKAGFDVFLEKVCRLLLSSQAPSQETLTAFRRDLQRLRSARFPDGLLNARMRLNEGFRCQDLSYHDVLTLADRFLATQPDLTAHYVVVGARTAGSYFSPLLKVYLEEKGFRNISWATIRPRFGTRGAERARLKRLLASGASAILNDDYSNTGQTLRMLKEIIGSFGVSPQNMIALTPVHPARTIRTIPLREEMPVITIDLDDLHRAKMMQPGSVETLLTRFRFAEGARIGGITDSSWTEATNQELWSHYADGFQVRLKRVYETTLRWDDGREEKLKIFAKGVGLGWLGYHAYLAGLVLTGYVPRVIGLADGILFMEWLEGHPLTQDELSDEVLERISSYIADRASRLRLAEDPRSEPPYLGWGWQGMLGILRRVYGRQVGYLKNSILLGRLRNAFHYPPALVDGRLRPEEWQVTEGGIFKLDFEQHCFGAPELDVVDPAYDIAIASFEFSLAESQVEKMIDAYARKCGDTRGLRDRVFLHKLLYATAEAERAHARIVAGADASASQRLFERLLWAWNFRAYATGRFCAKLIGGAGAGGRRAGLFFLDLDGVFDSEVLGFPHTTASGLEAIGLLRSAGFVVIPNTGRNCEQVREYCEIYGFPAGVAEHGSAIVDLTADREIPLLRPDTMDELFRCREAIRALDGVFVDPGYRFSVRALRFGRKGTCGLAPGEVEELIARRGFRKLRIIQRDVDTYVLGKEADKGEALTACRQRISPLASLIAAIGDSDEDVPMLERSTFAYAPANCSAGIRRLATTGRCAILQGRRQAGLLQAVREFLRLNGGIPQRVPAPPTGADSFGDLFRRLLAVPDQPLAARILLALSRKRIV